MQSHIKENFEIVNMCSLFDCLSEKEKQLIAITLTEAKVQQDQYLMKEGQPAYSIVIIKSGIVSCIQNGIERESKIGEVFSKQSVIPESFCDVTLQAKTQVTALLIYNKLLNELIPEKTEILLYQDIIKNTLVHDHFAKKIDNLTLNQIIFQFQIKHYQQGEVVIPKYTKWDYYYIVLEGEVNYFTLHGKKPKVLKGKSLGRYQIQYDKNHEIVLENVLMEKNGMIARINSDILKHAYNNQEKISARINLETLQNQENEEEYKIFNFIYLKFKEESELSSLILIKYPQNDKLFTMQMFPKKILVQQKQEKRLKRYKNFLLNNHFSRFPQFIRTFSIQNYVVFLYQLKYVIPFQPVLQELGLLSKADAVYYTTQMVYILEYIHLNSYIHRNFTLQSLSIDYKGRLQMMDCSTCKKIPNGRTSSIIGTPHYMAPEVLNRTDWYGYTVDLWSLGVCLFELMCGQVPFGEKLQDPIEIYESIQQESEDKSAKDLICQLLRKDPHARMDGNYDSLKAHAFFDSVDWDHLHNLVPPFIPPIKENYKKEVPELELKNLKIDSFKQCENHYVYDEKIPGWDYEFF